MTTANLVFMVIRLFSLGALGCSEEIVPYSRDGWKAILLSVEGQALSTARKILPAPEHAPSTGRRAPANSALRKPRLHRYKTSPPPATPPPTEATSGKTAPLANT